jgi:hypothetical protein
MVPASATRSLAATRRSDMVELLDLWMPIVLSAVIVFVASSIIWMASPLHKHDYKNPGDKEGPLLDLLRAKSFEPGVYYVPWCHGKANDPATADKMKRGPWASLTVLPGMPNMGKMLFSWFAHLLIVGVFVAYLTSHAGLAPGAEYLHVFRIAGTGALMAYAGYALPMCIWHGMPMSQLPGRLVDGAIYALLTAGTFAWLWPHAAGT